MVPEEKLREKEYLNIVSKESAAEQNCFTNYSEVT